MSRGDFTNWLHQITGHSAPQDRQRHLAMSECWRKRVVRVRTGLGKTEGVPGVWVWHRVRRDDASSPRRLACLETLLRVANCRASATRGVHSPELQP